jgi:GxxExxY protein
MIFKDESFQIIGCAMKVHNSLGFGLHEKPYENALTIEFTHNHISFEQQKRFTIRHRSIQVGEFIPDLIAFGKIIIDTKTIDQITDRERGQMLNYLRISGLQLGLLINFKNPRIEWERIVLTQQ